MRHQNELFMTAVSTPCEQQQHKRLHDKSQANSCARRPFRIDRRQPSQRMRKPLLCTINNSDDVKKATRTHAHTSNHEHCRRKRRRCSRRGIIRSEHSCEQHEGSSDCDDALIDEEESQEDERAVQSVETAHESPREALSARNEVNCSPGPRTREPFETWDSH
jgi:hypothetical protein